MKNASVQDQDQLINGKFLNFKMLKKPSGATIFKPSNL